MKMEIKEGGNKTDNGIRLGEKITNYLGNI